MGMAGCTNRIHKPVLELLWDIIPDEPRALAFVFHLSANALLGQEAISEGARVKENF